jgi:excinuclease UvrABC nuclease subunit
MVVLLLSVRNKWIDRMVLLLKINLSGSTVFKLHSLWDIPSKQGIYLIHDLKGVHYVGKSNNIQRRFEEHLLLRKNLKLNEILKNFCFQLNFSWIEISTEKEMEVYEKELIRYFNPSCNQIKYKTKGAC